jgi:hypothetical protein
MRNSRRAWASAADWFFGYLNTLSSSSILIAMNSDLCNLCIAFFLLPVLHVFLHLCDLVYNSSICG